MVRWLQRENVHFWRLSRFVSSFGCAISLPVQWGGGGEDKTEQPSKKTVISRYCWAVLLIADSILCHVKCVTGQIRRCAELNWGVISPHSPLTFWVQFSSVEECSVSLPQDSTLPLQLSHSLVSTCICSGNRRKSQCFVVKLTDSSVCTSGC